MGLIGGHMSIAGGLTKAIERGDALECEAIQIFIQSSRTWKINPPKSEETLGFKSALARAKHVKKVVAHNSYLLNLSTVDNTLRTKSVDYFTAIMEHAEALGLEGVITHPGSHLGAGVTAGIRATSESINEVLARCRGFRTRIILENTAGQGACIGHEFEHLKQIVENTIDPDCIYFCFDTQHAFAAGYDLRTVETYENTMAKFDKLLSLERIKTFHINDALKEFNCRVDRHQNIGKGFLGLEAFRLLVNDLRFKNVPMCLETDPGEKDEKHKQDLKTLRSLLH